jgi:hypothetical protein
MSLAPVLAQPSQHLSRVAPKDFAVMAWGNSPSDPEQLRGMREAGLNISGFVMWRISSAPALPVLPAL